MDWLADVFYRCRKDIMFRNVLFLRINSLLTLVLAVATEIIGYFSNSPFFHMLGVYYVILVIIRYVLVRGTDEEDVVQWHLYRFSAAVMLMMTLAILALNIQLMQGNRIIKYPWYLIYGVAFVCTIHVVTAIVAFCTGRERVTPVILAKKNCNLVVAAVSLLMLQYSLNAEFGDDPEFTRLMGSLMGMAIFLMIIILSVFMIWNSSKKIRELSD